MHDGRTRKVETPRFERPCTFLEQHRATLTLENGPEAGTEWALEGARTVLGRSDKAGIRIEDPSISAEHAAFEIDEEGFGVRDLASTNGVLVNGKQVLSVALEHGDRVRLGDCELRYVVEARTVEPRAWSVEEAEEDGDA